MFRKLHPRVYTRLQATCQPRIRGFPGHRTVHTTWNTQIRWNRLSYMALLSVVSGAAYFVGSNGSISPWRVPTTSAHKPTYATKAQMEKAIEELTSQLGEDAVTTDDDELRRHGYSEWSSINIDTLPVVIAYPRSTEDVSKIVKVCASYRIPIVPYSGGSSVEGNFAAAKGGVCLDFAMMNQILALHEDDLDVVVQPGITWMDLNRKIERSGLFFPVDPGPSAAIGGMVGTSCSGTNASRYGTMKDNVVNLTVVLADGSVIKTRQRPRKSAAGYNLTNLFIGSEGTLGVVTEATLKLVAIPAHTRVGLVTFPTIGNASQAASDTLKEGIQMGAMEIMDDVQMDIINRARLTDRKWATVPTMFVKFTGTENQITETGRLFGEIAKRNNGSDVEFARTAAEQDSLWAARKQALWSMLSLRKGDEEVWATDVAVPISRLPEIIDASKAEVAELGLFASILGHIADGNFHATILFDGQDSEEREKVERCVQRMVDRALEMEGTCTGEHGIGIGKKNHLKREMGPIAIGVMQKVKESLDPLWILNPGKIFDHALEDKVVGH